MTALRKQCSLHAARQMNVQTDMALTACPRPVQAQARQDPGIDSGGGHEIHPQSRSYHNQDPGTESGGGHEVHPQPRSYHSLGQRGEESQFSLPVWSPVQGRVSKGICTAQTA